MIFTEYVEDRARVRFHEQRRVGDAFLRSTNLASQPSPPRRRNEHLLREEDSRCEQVLLQLRRMVHCRHVLCDKNKNDKLTLLDLTSNCDSFSLVSSVGGGGYSRGQKQT